MLKGFVLGGTKPVMQEFSISPHSLEQSKPLMKCYLSKLISSISLPYRKESGLGLPQPYVVSKHRREASFPCQGTERSHRAPRAAGLQGGFTNQTS